MDDKHSVVQPPDRAQARPAHSGGIIRQLAYTPAQDGHGIGQLRTNNIEDGTQVPHLEQVTSFTPWCAPAERKTAGPQPSDMDPSEVATSQENWLLEHLPEASIDDGAAELLLLEEIASSKAETQLPPPGKASLFSVGEISDLRDIAGAVKGHPALAVASGVAGNVLRFISLTDEEWLWTEADVRVRLHSPNLRLQGEWCQDGIPISLIKFAVDSMKYDPIRWLLVQSGTSTTVYEPELRAIPMPSASTSARGPSRSAAGQIFANPLFTIPCRRTGGAMPSDVCFRRYPETHTPQLVIIDQRGYWSLWDITGRRNARPKRLTPVMRMCGISNMESIPKSPSNAATEPRPHRVLCLSLGDKNSSPSADRSSSPSKQFQGSVEAAPGDPQRPLLLLSTSRSLHVFDLATEKLHPVSRTVLPADGDRILDVAPSPLGSSQAFILTSQSLMLVAAREGKHDAVLLHIPASCPHGRDSDPTLQLDISPVAYINGHIACFVCVWSSRSCEMTVVWFVSPDPGAPIQYHRDLIFLQSPSNFASLSMLPVERRMGAGEPTSAAAVSMRKTRLRFFQLVTLGHDLDVHSALCVWSDDPRVPVPPPDTRVDLEDDSRKRRVKLLRNLTRVFTVPDEFDERIVFRRKETKSQSPERISPRHDFTFAAQRLSAAVAADGPVPSANGDDFGFLARAIERETKDEYMSRRSILDLVGSDRPGELFRIAREWDAQRDVLHRRAEDWVYVPEARRPLQDFGPDDIIERLGEMFPMPQVRKGKRLGLALSENRGKALQTMAAEMFLASIGVSVLPRSWTTAAAEAAESDTTGTPIPSSLPFRSSPSVTSSAIASPSEAAGISSSGSANGKSKENQKAEKEEGERRDAVALRMRKYAVVNTSPKFATHSEEPSVGLTRWELGADPDDITWRPGQDLEAEAAIQRKREKIEKRRRRAERLSQRILGLSAGGEDSLLGSSSQPGTGPPSSSQPVIISTSQPPVQRQPWEFASQQIGSPRVFVGSPLRREYRLEEPGLGADMGVGSQQSQEQMSQGTPSQPTSQVLPGPYGGRLSPFKRSPLKKKGKRLSDGRRVSGFR